MAFQSYMRQMDCLGTNCNPVSILMFSTFEHTVDILYRDVIGRRKEDCWRAQQLGLSNPADNIVASLYNKKADNIMQAVKKIGLVNLFTRSLPIRITMVGPVIKMQWLFYDTIKVLTGL
ncbi:mitochondrial phosphate carrier protein 1, mitochondrial [Cinnamomum micranthum f. kanehirae]|uniref:Mitochondrial phosphate carrier protein 1, mitochondrial n=1 Tax=Cinnamomum micranthum f. kanehirae TaxID=337451 RepID=A0A3S3N8Y9_9MAGN|nr:mitochondrial phosphate carrier protein 1, mitochondrial [Cinnamomum micranthum f. kanehirae]